MEKTRACFSPNSVKTTKGKLKKMMSVNVSSAFLIEIGKLIQVTNISLSLTRSNRDKSQYNVYIKDKTRVLTCGKFKSVNNHSELRRAKAEAAISHKSIPLQIQIRRGLDIFSLLLCVTSHLFKGSYFN